MTMIHPRTILALLALIAASGCSGGSPSPTVGPPAVSASRKLSRSSLAKHVSLDLRGVPLDKALARIAAQEKIRIRIRSAVKANWPIVAPKAYLRVRDIPLE